MANREITLNLPETLAEEAARLGLLEPEALRQRRLARMFATMDELAATAPTR